VGDRGRGRDVLMPKPKYGPVHPSKECSETPCPGDPMCPHTELARIADRAEMMPAMKRLHAAMPKAMKTGLGLLSRQDRDETLYILCCAIGDETPVAPVEGYRWPYRLPEQYRR
jgi:hypothetical protein